MDPGLLDFHDPSGSSGFCARDGALTNQPEVKHVNKINRELDHSGRCYRNRHCLLRRRSTADGRGSKSGNRGG
jgi:hypothetical protein